MSTISARKDRPLLSVTQYPYHDLPLDLIQPFQPFLEDARTANKISTRLVRQGLRL
jgi:hypothetical protein